MDILAVGNVTAVLIGIVSLAIGAIATYVVQLMINKAKAEDLNQKLQSQIEVAKREAENIIKTAELDAARDVMAKKEVFTKEVEQTQEKLREKELTLSKQEDALSRKSDQLDQRDQQLKQGNKELNQKKQSCDARAKHLSSLIAQQKNQLLKITSMDIESAKDLLLTRLEDECEHEMNTIIERRLSETKEVSEEKSREIISSAIQRYASSVASEITSTTVNLPSDELKGRVIGKEGRNIKTLERLTGVEVLVDDTPGAIVVSSFDPIRRQIAKLTLDKLLLDGRIQPARIEEQVVKAEEEINEKIQEAGQAAVYDVGIAGLDPKLIKLLGRLRFRTSYGQNVLLHSLEVSHLAGAIAAELGADVNIAKKAALLHDIGKSVDHEVQGSHVEIGRNILKKFNIDDRVIEAMQAHHEEYPFSSIESIIIQAADAISGARPGARKDTLEAYLKRLEELETVANSFDGIEKTYAIQAGREIRVFVRPEHIDDYGAYKLAKDVAEKIQQELKYPGEIKVNVIRETRAVEYAR